MFKLIVYILGIGLVDSLNPSTILLTIYLLTTAKPVKRVASFISGVFLTNFALGSLVFFLVGETFSLFFAKLLNINIPWWGYIIQFIAGLALIYSGYKVQGNKKPEAVKKPKEINPINTFVLGIGSTIVDFSTAAPYIGAIAVIANAGRSTWENLLLLVTYNLVYTSIPICLFLVYLIYRAQAEPVIARANSMVNKTMPKLTKILFIGLGIILTLDSIGYVFGYPIFM